MLKRIKTFFADNTKKLAATKKPIDLIQANAIYKSHRHLTVEEIGKKWQLVQLSSGPAQLLSQLHDLEVTVSDDYLWPWQFWRNSSDQLSEFNAILPHEAPEQGLDQLTELAAAIYRYAFRARTDTVSEVSAVYSKAMLSAAALRDLAPSFQFELALHAFSDKKWALLETITTTLLHRWKIREIQLNDRIAALSFELLLRAQIQRGMSLFVLQPKDLIAKLDKVAEDQQLFDALGQQSVATGLFMAARKAFSGDIAGSVSGFDAANKQSGIRSTAYASAQILLPIEEAVAADEHQLLKWFSEYSQIRHHFCHAGADEHAILVASEQKYLEAYGELYAETLSISNPNALVHFHLINLDHRYDHVVTLFEDWEKRFGLRINYSFETNKVMHELPDYIAGISVTTRYIYLPDYLAAYKSLTLTDIDGWLTAKISALSDFGTADTMISSWIWRKNTGHWRLPWANLAGGYISFRASENTTQLSSLLRTYLLLVIKRNVPLNRHITYADQAGLFLGLQYGVNTWGHGVGFMPKVGFAQSHEQREKMRYEGKSQAMREKLAELKADSAAHSIGRPEGLKTVTE